MTPVVVVGIGADGWEGLGATSRQEITDAEVLIGSARQLELVPDGRAERVRWPSPMLPVLADLFAEHRGRRVCVLASGDPMFHGIGTTLVRILGAERVRVLPHVSSASLACARMGWPLDRVTVRSVVNRPATTIVPDLAAAARLVVLAQGPDTPGELAALLAAQGFGASALTVLARLGGPDEHRLDGTAENWNHPAVDPLHVVAVECRRDPAIGARTTRLPGLDDDSFAGDGQMTKQEIRALTLCALAPTPGEVLWDVGGGSGTIAIEWMRTDPRCRAVTFERDPLRQVQIGQNAGRLGVPDLRVRGAAPDDFPDVAGTPDAVFLGGGLTQEGLFDACWERLLPGGRLVANAVTAESEAAVLSWFRTFGGDVRRFQVYRGSPLGGFTTWRPQLPVTQWSVVKGARS
ncbi:precorrin-6y C5,15-methyltransferase (decarboxylating) subunit CbiE [Rhodococcus triatomae]|uniref:Precorrin-6Y C5,15-methyltransferase (Decarboxylating) n=1 Tax=Rhodococcus triatomae TaxID=300028 RepID=A0A1G8P3B0_9NOCA|nr:precorrin-6y C5,15-methyltransferase (decarboxylating) subunit CbiE [Rhodococcus triatomae]QNG18764.1 precorrin-6y C5,15-methyltransferase (decarboxylating) subunit CbiE [Rhodococcus triatomae]QNG25325.1 precorrin-6y C5,15-methyltransferase (decarboxylating) subunit CbiE [Rhodococcus triatomae]SDI86756.1 precorrin-6Y C5,15-methyltransferase (decarboxylating) [Rhodococcus triatomae]